MIKFARAGLWLMVIAAIAAGLYLRVIGADSPFEGFSGKAEARSALAASPGTHETARPDSVYPYFVKGAFAIAGESEIAARSVSIFASLLSILLIYKVGKKLYGERAGLIAALIWTSAPIAVITGRTATGDAMSCMFFIAFIYLLLLPQSLKKDIAAAFLLGLSTAAAWQAALLYPVFLAVYLKDRVKYDRLGMITLKSTVIALPALFLFLPEAKALTADFSTASAGEIFWGFSPFVLFPAGFVLFYNLKNFNNPLFSGAAASILLFLIFPALRIFLLFALFFSVLVLSGEMGKWRFGTVISMFIIIPAGLVSLLHISGFKYGADTLYQFSGTVNSQLNDKSAVIVLNSNMQENYRDIMAYYCRKCSFFVYDSANDGILGLDYAKNVYYVDYFTSRTAPNPVIELIYKKKYGLTFNGKLLMFDKPDENSFSVKRIIFRDVKGINPGLSRKWGLNLLWEYPVISYLKVPGGFGLSKENGVLGIVLNSQIASS